MVEISLSDVGLCTVDGAAEIRGVNPRTVGRWIASGGLPVAVIGAGRYRKYLLRIADVRAYTPPPVGAPTGPRAPKPGRAKAEK